ncbi:MAG TPA: methionyl-tRNA formyltransferase [Patescibacteria group bacterium]|nr:methionyl-tRNA formyltransferase [Patescibacteria group bacterium]
MKKTSETIIFFGSGPVAAESLRLLAQKFRIEAVITKPRPAHHRGSVPVLEAAEELELNTYTAKDRKELDNFFHTATFESRLGVLIDFGIIVSRDVINFFPLGILNSHFSILPEWRGADPITFAVLSGQETTGVSLMLLVEAMDEGPLLGYGEHELTPETTASDLTADLIKLSFSLLKTVVPAYLEGAVKPAPQAITGRETSYSRKLTKIDGEIDWSKPAQQIEREVRAFIEWPKSHATLGKLGVIITEGHVVSLSGKPGIVAVINGLPVVYCGEQALELVRLKPAGKKEMTGQAFLAGYKSALNI